MDVDDELAERGELGDDLDTFNALGEFTDAFVAFVASVFEPNLSNFSLIAGWHSFRCLTKCVAEVVSS